MPMKAVVLAPGKEKSALRKHPWLFSGAIQKVMGSPESGDSVEVYANNGTFLGIAAYSPESQIRCRFWTFKEKAEINREFFSDVLDKAIESRRSRGFDINDTKSAFRLVNAENDGIPGCIIDKYADIYCAEILATGADKFRNDIFELLAEKTHCRGILERSDSDVRLKEGLPIRKEVAYGDVPKTPVEMIENGIKFDVDVWNGHKTGYYLDQRDARFEVGRYGKGKRVLNCFSYTGGFGLFALQNGASSVTEIDVSTDALNIARSLIQKNGFDSGKVILKEADVFTYLRSCRDSRETFDLIVLDPPKFIESKAHLNKGARGYKDINLLALKLLAPNGILATFSCSGLMEMDLFQKIVADAAVDANREVQIIKRFGQPADHPVKTTFPEGQYLKGLLLEAR
ncbi:MAG: class I SAM-dependent methyltransferase [Fibrobacteraceae bacterium]|nr:class I SAM-dependent methyltransferase [Fibrobacteraceae bacterium]